MTSLRHYISLLCSPAKSLGQEVSEEA